MGRAIKGDTQGGRQVYLADGGAFYRDKEPPGRVDRDVEISSDLVEFEFFVSHTS